MLMSLMFFSLNRYRNNYHRDSEYKRSNSRSIDRYERDRYRQRERDYRYQSRSGILSPNYDRDYAQVLLGKSLLVESYHPKREVLRGAFSECSPTPHSRSPPGRAMDSRSPFPRADEFGAYKIVFELGWDATGYVGWTEYGSTSVPDVASEVSYC
ncbi:hypothetical protein FXO38_22302 [Capsicum annuum]|nr:hypothetical protein FXO37_32423 [Capsicum annuum]KAF3640075.1 hypothetical protein FXO38_22302 [Capsicum annuum]